MGISAADKNTFEADLNKAKDDEDFDVIINIANQIAQAGDNEWAKLIYKEIENSVENNSSCINPLLLIGNGACNIFGDQEWGRTVFKRVEFEAFKFEHYLDLSKNVAKYLGDRQWSEKLFKQTEPLANDCYGLYSLGDGICQYLKDKEWAKKIYKEAEKQADSFNDWRRLANGLSRNLGDKDWAKSAYTESETLAETNREFQSLGLDLMNYLGDSEWGEKILAKSLDLLKSDGKEWEDEGYQNELEEKFLNMIKVRVTQHLINSEEEFIKELSKSEFSLPNEYSFENIYDEDDDEDGSILIFEVNEKELETLISSAKKVSVDYIQIDKLDELENLEEEIYCTY